MASQNRPKASRRFVLSAAVVALLAVAPAASAAEAPAAGSPQSDASSGPSSDAGSQPERLCTQQFCLFLREKGRFETIAFPFRAVYTTLGINDRGEITGASLDDPSALYPRGFHGFLRDPRGRFARFDAPSKAGTTPIGLNDRGQIVGNYCSNSVAECPNGRRGFLRERGGRFVTIHFPGALETQAFGINDRGQVVGNYLDTAGEVPRLSGGTRAGSRKSTFPAPSRRPTSMTVARSSASMAMIPNDPTGATGAHGFLLSRGDFTTFDAPGVPFTTPLASTTAARSQASPPLVPSYPRQRCTDSCSRVASRAPSRRSTSRRARDRGVRHQRSRPDALAIRRADRRLSIWAEPSRSARPGSGVLSPTSDLVRVIRAYVAAMDLKLCRSLSARPSASFPSVQLPALGPVWLSRCRQGRRREQGRCEKAPPRKARQIYRSVKRPRARGPVSAPVRPSWPGGPPAHPESRGRAYRPPRHR